MTIRLAAIASICLLSSCASSTSGGDTGVVDTGIGVNCPARSDVQGMTCDPAVNTSTCRWSCYTEGRNGGYDRTGVCDSTGHWRVFDDTTVTQCAGARDM